MEADERQVTANQRFPLFFAEKRPLFLEGAELFRTPIRAFHSRSVVDPELATKATVTLGRTRLVALVAADPAPGRVPDDDPLLAPLADRRANAGVYGIANSSTVSDCTVYAGPSSTRRLRNAVT